MSGSDAAALKAVGERIMPFSSKIQALGAAKYPRRCGAAQMRLDRRGEVGGGGDVGGVGDLAGCANEFIRRCALVSFFSMFSCSILGSNVQ